MSTCLVTGGCGFIGSHLVDRLILEGHKVVVLDDLSTGNKANLNPNVEELAIRSITEPLDDLFVTYLFDRVYHLAGQINLRESLKNPIHDAQINIMGGLNLIDCSVRYKVDHFIFSSTGGAIYSENAALPWSEHSKTEPSSPYGLSKLTIENYLRIAKEQHKLNYTILRYSNVYGARQNFLGEAGVVSIFINKLLKNEPITIFGTGAQTRDFIYVSDVVEANIIAPNLPSYYQTYNVSTGIEISINELVQKLDNAFGSKSKINYSNSIKGELLYSCLNPYRLKLSGWAPKVSLEEGVEKTIEYFQNS